MWIKSPKDIAKQRLGGQLLSQVHSLVAQHVQPGVNTQQLDKLAEEYIRDHGAQPSFQGFKGFPACLCTCVNDAIVHSIPSAQEVLQEGDIISIDCGIYYQGYHTDAALTHPVGAVSEKLLNLLAQTKKALRMGIAKATTQHCIGDISHAIQQTVEKAGYTPISTYGGHGIGEALHEAPYIPNVGKPGVGDRIQEGMVLAIEPLVTLGSDRCTTQGHWQVRTADGKPCAHFEQTIAIVDGQAEILTPYTTP